VNTTMLKFLALFLGFALWAALGFFCKVPLDPLIALLQMGLGGLVAHMLQDAGAAPVQTTAPPAAGQQGGFALVRLLAIVAAIAVGLALAGCSTTMRAYEAAAYNEIKSADDNTLSVLKVAFCGQPLSAFLRNSDMIPGAKALCLPGGNASDPSALLDAGKQPITINLTMPPAAASAAK
jgi:hypothetical protein